ncbi:MAG: hypothetical protein GY864_14370 [Desulfobacterales bacterium]|nr:hypothetical protein [Desulfobacterales bacterium]
MSLLEKYVEYARIGDAKKIASLFAEDAVFYDEGPTKVGRPVISLKGQTAIEAMFTEVFKSGGFNIVNVAINGSAMRYDVKYGDTDILLLGVITEENGLIGSYEITIV